MWPALVGVGGELSGAPATSASHEGDLIAQSGLWKSRVMQVKRTISSVCVAKRERMNLSEKLDRRKWRCSCSSGCWIEWDIL